MPAVFFLHRFGWQMALGVKSNFLSLAGLFLSSRGIHMESYKKKKTIFFLLFNEEKSFLNIQKH
jgi:hypothetical protein